MLSNLHGSQPAHRRKICMCCHVWRMSGWRLKACAWQEDDGEYDPTAADEEFADAAGGEGRQREEEAEEAEFDEAAFDEAERKQRVLSGTLLAHMTCMSCSA